VERDIPILKNVYCEMGKPAWNFPGSLLFFLFFLYFSFLSFFSFLFLFLFFFSFSSPWPFQSLASRYTDCAILAAVYERIILKMFLMRCDGRVWDEFLLFTLEDSDNLS
jgi:hypothetical protein